MSEQARYPRDMAGYGRQPPHPRWPGDARIAVQFVINYEEGAESNILHGDNASEAFLSEIVGAEAWPGQRHMNMESLYEYGSRAGFWRLHRIFSSHGVPVTVFAVATALQRNRDVVAAMKEADWEIASHGLRWIDYRNVSAEDEQRQVLEAIDLHTRLTGNRPLGFYQGRTSSNSVNIVMEEQGFLYSADSYADDLPYWIAGPHGPQLMVPYTLDVNDMRFATPQGFNSGDQFFTYLRDSFDILYAEGQTCPRMLSIGLHCRLAGRPGRAAALARFIGHIRKHDKVWTATRLDIARHWIATHAPAGGYVPSRMPRALFVERFGDIFEHTPQIAEMAHLAGLTSEANSAEGLHKALTAQMRALPARDKAALIKSHPDLAGRLALANELTADSTIEQTSAGLDKLSPAELAQFTDLNDAYKVKFGFPFIFAVKGRTKDEIISSFETRLLNDSDTEFQEALRQIERIALLRLRDRLPSAE